MTAMERITYEPLPLWQREIGEALEARRPHVQGEEPGERAFEALVDALAALEAMPAAGYSPRATAVLEGLALRGVVLARRLLEARDRARGFESEARR